MASPLLPAGPREPPWAQTLEWVARPTAFLRRCHARHGDAFTLRLTFDDAPTVVLAAPDAIRAVFAAPDVARRGEAPGVLAPVTGPRSISALDGEPHLRARRLLLAPFHGDALARWRAAVAEVAAAHVAAVPRGRPVALLPVFGALTLEAIVRVVLGARDDALLAHARAALTHVRALPRAAALSLAPPGTAVWRPFLRHVRAAEARIAAIVAARRARGGGGDDVLGALLDAGCDDEEIRDHVLTLIAAGHDTTAGALGWAAERLARHPSWQRTDDAALDAVVRETLRVRPVLTVAPRRLATPLRAGALRLPAGVHVAPCLYLVGRRPELHPRPDAFDPGRWLGGTPPPSFGWLPFGGGTRRCTGAAFAHLEMVEVLRALLRAGNLAPEPGHARGERPRRRGVTLQPERGARVVVT